MNETTIDISEINPVDLYGVNDTKLTTIKKFFPRIKIIARGNELKAIGEDNELSAFKQKIALLIAHFLKYKQLSENNIERLMSEDGTLENSETLREMKPMCWFMVTADLL